MALGRIRRNRSKVNRMLFVNTKRLQVNIEIFRHSGRAGNYSAMACMPSAKTGAGRRVTYAIRTRKSCSRHMIGRTPQAAIAKALKGLAVTVAKRGRYGPGRGP